MHINLNFEYDKLHLKEIIILIPKYHPNMISFLTPILGLYGINIKEFINDFDVKTRFINFEVVIPVIVKISKIKTFEIILKTPFIVSILSNLDGFSLTKPIISLLSLYKISLLKSIFRTHFLYLFHKRIYISIRKYLSLIVRSNFDLSVGSINSQIPYDLSRLLLLKNTLRNFLIFKGLSSFSYGFFIVFNNASASRINYLKTALSLLNIFITKIKPRFLSSLTGKKYFYGNTFYISSNKFNYCWRFFREFYQKKFLSNLFPLYWKLGVNLLHQSFFKEFFNSFNLIIKFVNFYFLKILYLSISKSLKVIGYINIKLLLLLAHTNKNAYLSSNIS